VTTVTRTEDRAAPQAADPVVVLVDGASETERDLIARWARDAHPSAELIDRDDPALGSRLDRDDDPLVVPVRVTWLPNGREDDSSTYGDLRALISPRRPPGPLQGLIAKRAPGRVRVSAGEPAHAKALLRDFDAESGGGGRDAFAAFVTRRATLAVDRVERQLLGDRYKVPRLVAEQIAASARVRERAQELADRLGRPVDDVLTELAADLQELAAVQSPPAIDAFRAFMGPLHRRAWTVHEDVEGLECLRELNKSHALIFLPSHRSYADPLVMADVLHRHDFPRNHVLGGNNVSFWPIGPLGKRAGMIFIRRSFGDDQVYKLAVSEYFGHLVAKRFNLEWYMEGGRTRTGKLRPPRYGLLAYLVRALQNDHAEDAMLVPVSIAYEQLQEVGAMAAEQGGAAKSAEGLGWLAGYWRAQAREAGVARVRFGEPLSLRQALEEAGEENQLEKIAFRISVGINRATPVTSSALVTFALLSVRDRAMTLTQVHRVVEPLLDHLDARSICGPLEDMRDPEPLARTLQKLTLAGVVSSFDEGAEPVWWIAPDQRRVAAFYRNGAVHHVVNRAILELAVLKVATDAGEDLVGEAWEESLRLRDLLKFEFFFARKQRFSEELTAELTQLAHEAGAEIATADPAALIAGAPILVAHAVLRSFIDAQFVVAEMLMARDPLAEFDRKELVKDCLGYARQLRLQGQVHGAETISRELFEGALRLVDNRDLLSGTAYGGLKAWHDELVDVRERLIVIRQIDQARLEGVLDGDA
jgi:glycerol-3-phosphate O-acyltransferase